jgi:hypothetical protein
MNLSRIAARTAAEVCGRFDIGEEAKTLLRPELSPGQYLELLKERSRFPAAMQFLAFALPKPEAVWWACRCVRESAGSAPAPASVAALQAAEKWVSNPTDENRRAAMPVAQTAGLATAAGAAALAAFVSGGSLAPANIPPVPPADTLTAQAVSGAVLVAAVERETEKAFDKFRRFLAIGIEVANGTSRWDTRR